MLPIKVVVVGAGHLGGFHLQKIAADDNAILVAIVEPKLDKHHDLRQKYNVPIVESLNSFSGTANAAIIASPTSTHLELGLAAFARGWHVLLEKPLAVTPADGEKLVTAAQQQGCLLQVGHIERYNPAVSAALSVADQPGYIVTERLSPFSGRSTDVDVILDLMIHDLDIVGALVAAPLVEARAIGVPVLSHKVDMAAARLAFADGTVAQLSAGRASLEPSRKIRLFTKERYLSIDCQNREVKSVRRLPPNPDSDWAQIEGEPINIQPGDPLALQDHDFLESIINKRQPRVDGVAGLKALKLAAAVKEAMSIPTYSSTAK
ncbi:MAG: Gfo/Idh/MocA family oxidoreductase [Deltaproteobacteria bacterium]|nr:Gfo/Idh/MocA family oxidoreductase [Deltaproteobacteria bacterium]